MITNSTTGDQAIAAVYVVADREIVFDASMEAVWRYVVDYASWQNYSSVEHVSGGVGQEGEVVLMRKEGVALPFYTRTIRLDPGRRIMWKTYPERRATGNDYFGFVDFKLDDLDGRTRFRSDTVYEFMVPYDSPEELETFQAETYEKRQEAFWASLARLKQLVEKT